MLKGSTYAVGGTTECWMDITSNYAKQFEESLGAGGILSLNGTRINYVKSRIRDAVARLIPTCELDCLLPTEGNARRALIALFQLCELVDADTCTLRVEG